MTAAWRARAFVRAPGRLGPNGRGQPEGLTGSLAQAAAGPGPMPGKCRGDRDLRVVAIILSGPRPDASAASATPPAGPPGRESRFS